MLASSAVTTAAVTAAQSAMLLWFAVGSAITGVAAALCHDMARKLVFAGFRHSEHK